jgi:hypothetical protein
VLEKMCPGYSAAQLFELDEADEPSPDDGGQAVDDGGLFDVIEDRIDHPAAGAVEWGPEQPADAGRSYAGLAASAPGVSEETQRLGQRLLKLKKVQRLSDRDISQFAHLAGPHRHRDQR